jgi:UTP:GlnB (protein PII) uridylyltransferase
VTTSADLFRDRKAATDARLNEFEKALRGRLADAPNRLADDTCLYVTGSGGRGELSRHSDLDIFLVRDGDRPSRLDQMVLGSAVEGALRDCDFPAPSNDGEFLTLHRVSEMLSHMG